MDHNYRPIFKGIIEEKSFEFSKSILAFTLELKERRMFEIASQLLRSGTSIGANIAEAGYASSRKDFINKLKISSKEMNETMYWLLLLRETGNGDSEKLLDLIKSVALIRGMLLRSLKTALSAEE